MWSQADIWRSGETIKTGASKLIVADLVDEMVDDVIIPCLKMDAKYETYLLGTAFARPVIGKKLAEIMRPKRRHIAQRYHGNSESGPFRSGHQAFRSQYEDHRPVA